jgi:hypothetical protein
LRIKGDDTPIAPGEFRDVDVGSGSIRDNILPLPYKEPSMVLSGLMDKIIDEARRFAATSDMKISDMSNQAPVGTTLAILERSLKVMSAVQARVHYALKQELQLIAGLIRDYTDPDYTYEPEEGRPSAKREDYSIVEVIPVSDPNAATLSQRVVQYQAVIQLAQMAPQIYDLPFLHRQMLDVLFSGSNSRQATGMSEVSLTFDNSDKAIQIDYSGRLPIHPTHQEFQFHFLTSFVEYQLHLRNVLLL